MDKNRLGELLLSNGYLLHDLIGRGGMSSVWRARSLALNRDVAVKHLERAYNDGSIVTEARALARLNHPAIAQVYDVLIDRDQGACLIMELLRGCDLGQLVILEGPVAAERAVEILLPVIDGLAVAHASDITHGDIKPDNIFLTRANGRLAPKLFDFGVARAASARERQTKIAGTPEYMAPEHFRGDRGMASDQWSAALSLYVATTATHPFVGRELEQLYQAVKARPLPYPRETSMDPRLFAILARATRKDPADRYPDMAALHQALEDWLTGKRPPRARGTRETPYINA